MFDRFILLSSVFFIYSTNTVFPFQSKLTFKKMLTVVGTQIGFDWLKHMIMFKISNIKVHYLKLVSFELGVFHEKLKFNCFDKEQPHYSSSKGKHNYLKYLCDYKLTLYNKDRLETYLGKVETDHLLTIELKNSILLQSILVDY